MFNASEQSDKQQNSEPSVDEVSRPIYRATDYGRGVQPPPPPNEMSSARVRARDRHLQKQKPRASEWLWVVVAAILFAFVLLLTIGAIFLINAAPTEAESATTQSNIIGPLPTPVYVVSDFNSATFTDQITLADGSSLDLAPWDGTSRFTMIIAGIDRRPNETGLQYRTDTMMLISLNPLNNRIGVLSIPRDMYVQVPGYSARQRVNSAMVLGELAANGAGPDLMMQTLQLNLGMRVNDYLVVDFQAFIDFVDTLGGVAVQTDKIINDPQYPDMNYGYDPFYLPIGTHQLDGYNTLRFARTRHGDNDIQRAGRQQQVLYAIRDKATDLETLPSLLVQAPVLWQSFSDNVHTGLNLEQILQLALYAKDVPAENIQMGVIDYTYLRNFTTSAGASVLIPDQARLASLMTSVFGPDYNQ